MISVYLVRPDNSPYYYAQYVLPGTTRRKTRSLKTEDFGEARRLAADLEYELNHGIDPHLVKIDWPAFVERFVRERLADGAPEARRNARRNLLRFGTLAKPAGPAAVSADMVSRFASAMRHDEGYSPATVQTMLAHLHTALRWAQRMGMARQLPFFPVLKLPRKKLKPHLSPEKFPELLALCPSPEWALFCQVAWHTGMRLGELYLLRWGPGDGPWLDLARQRVRFPAEFCKGRTDDWLPLHPALLPLLAAVPEKEGRVFDLAPTVRALSDGFCTLARPLRCQTHMLRRSFGTRYAPVVPAHILQRLMRHANIKTTLEYYADLDPALEAAISLA